MSLLARLLVLAGAVGAGAASSRSGLPGGPEEAAVMVRETMLDTLEVEQLEGGGMLIGTSTAPRGNLTLTHQASSMLTQLSVPIVSLGAGGAVYALFPQYKTAAQLLLFFGAQAFMNLYMKAILSNSVVSAELNMRGFQAPLVLTALQQLVGFFFLAIAIGLSQLTRWAYRPRLLETKQQVIAILALAVCFTLNIALNNFSLSLIDMSVNVMIRSSSPLTSLILQLIFHKWFIDHEGVDVRPPKVGLMMLGVIFALLVVIAKHSSKGAGDQDGSTLGLVLCVASLLFSSMELIVVVILGNGFKLNPVDTLLYMALPVFVLLLLPSFCIKHPVAYPGHAPATDFSVLMEVARLNPNIVVLVMLSGIWALGYNLLLYNMVRGLSPYFASFAANFNKVAAIGLALLMGLEALPTGGWKVLMVVGVLGNMASFTAYSLWPSRPPSERDAENAKLRLREEKATEYGTVHEAKDPESARQRPSR